MNQIKCPKCGEIFKIDESDYLTIVNQIRDQEFKKQVEEQVRLKEEKSEADKRAALAEQKAEIEKSFQAEKERKEKEIQQLKSDAAAKNRELQFAVEKQKTELELKEKDFKLEKERLSQSYEVRLALKDEEIQRYKDFKAQKSVKLLGEDLEQHCEIEFNKMRAVGFQNAYFEKDNEVSDGSKGDFIFRERDADGTEILSIMFEMKNEADNSQNRKKNEDFLLKLDKDRKKKNCEYAVLVSMLEADNEYYNSGIVDMSHKYPKMYVVRPQFFIPIITILRNAALRSLEDRRELALARSQNIDITNFENEMNDFKKKFSENYRIASDHFQTAIKEIDETIKHLEKVKKALTGSDRQLRLVNDKAEDLSIKKLTKNSPSLRAKFEEIKHNSVLPL